MYLQYSCYGSTEQSNVIVLHHETYNMRRKYFTYHKLAPPVCCTVYTYKCAVPGYCVYTVVVPGTAL